MRLSLFTICGTGYNAMIHVRGNDRDFNRWSEAGNPTWDYESVLPYFKKFEGVQVANMIDSDKFSHYHNTNGPVKIDLYQNSDAMRSVVIEAAKALKYEYLSDINANNSVGLTLAHGTIDGNRRCTTAKAYLVPAKDRSNLFVIKNAHVTKLQINRQKVVTGVHFIVNNKKMTANVGKEVVLSAGAVNTPQILMLSGIGPKKHLDELQIPVVMDLPVGKNLQDHPYLPLPLAIKQPNDSFVYESFIEVLQNNLRKDPGPAGYGLFDLLGFFDTNNKSGKYADIQTHYVHIEKNAEDIMRFYLRSNLGYTEQFTQTIIDANQKSAIFFALIILLNPKSSGEILLKSTDPFDAPIIRANYLDNIEDVKTLIRGIRLTQEFLHTDAFRRHQIEEVHLNIPECNCIDDRDSDNYYECITRHIVATLFHPVGTCKMGPKNDPLAVVDPRLRVRGIKQLRIADASIMPNITSGNTNAPVIMIGKQLTENLLPNKLQSTFKAIAKTNINVFVTINSYIEEAVL